ncbi:hypothetical protein [Serratia fonticola]|uniref:hypothetical protein n=1 Tax=Serratia fonticola TaxID=47917 RepID=UPI00217814BA|nr:hypothetical protein [Serratia fonticola]CAI1211180.1 Lipoprotein NlpI, contains TPR repeats [Serratia fonticola]CAI1217525.1 Lipoprotein NlpI, contains TPR repeats [Serratia fonticola]
MKTLALLSYPTTQRWHSRVGTTINLVAFCLLSLGGGISFASSQNASVVFPAASAVVSLPSQASEVTPLSPSDSAALFQQAIADDLASRPMLARQAYDALKHSDMAVVAAVPSAINLVSLGQFGAARQAFDAVTASRDARERDYAHLWQLWLTARTYSGKPQALKKELARLATGMNVRSPSQQALIRLYAGKGSADAVFAAIAAMPNIDELQRRDALTEATFFTGGYLQFVAHNNKAALQLYKREQNQLNSTSLERPLINLIAATLQASNSNFLPLMEPGK